MHPTAVETHPEPDDLLTDHVRWSLDQLGDLLHAHPEVLDGFAQSVLRHKLDEALVLCAKQLDYGPANIANPPGTITPQVALTIRVNDKVQRLGNLITQPQAESQNEPVADSWLDTANYGTIGAMLESGSWPTVPSNGR